MGAHWGWAYQSAGSYGHTVARYVEIEIDDRDNPQGFVQVGRAPVGPAIIFRAMRQGARVEPERIDNLPRRRFTLPLQLLTRDQLAQVLMYFGHRHEMPSVMFFPAPDRAGKNVFELPFLGTVDESLGLTHRRASIDKWDGTLKITEDR